MFRIMQVGVVWLVVSLTTSPIFKNSPANISSSVPHAHVIHHVDPEVYTYTHQGNPLLKPHQCKISMNKPQCIIKPTIPLIKPVTRKQSISAPDLEASLPQLLKHQQINQ